MKTKMDKHTHTHTISKHRAVFSDSVCMFGHFFFYSSVMVLIMGSREMFDHCPYYIGMKF